MSSLASRPPAAERDEIVAVARNLARRELAPRALALDEGRPGALDAAWARVTEIGFDRALLAPEDGGSGLDAGCLLRCLEQIAAGDGGVALLVLLSNAALAALPSELAARVEPGRRWALVPAPPAELPTAARIVVSARAGGELVLDGVLSPALGAAGADGVVVVTAGADPALLALPAGTPGVRIEPCERSLGLRAAAAARISLSGAEAVAPPVEPAPTEALADAANAIAIARAGAAAIARGVASRAQELALAYAQVRVQGGVPIVEHDAVRDMLAAMTVRGAATRSLARVLREGEAAVLAAKLAAADAAVATTTDAVQVFGGAGYMHETGVEKLMRDAACLQRWPEPSWVARDRLLERTG